MLNDAIEDLNALHLRAMACRLKAWVEDPANQLKSHTECVRALVSAQMAVRSTRRTTSVLQVAGLPMSACLDDFWKPSQRGVPTGLLANLTDCDWVRAGHSLVLTGGAFAGKTYLAAALMREAAGHRLSLGYWRLPELLGMCALEQLKGVDDWSRFVKQMAKPKLLVLDDFAMERCHPTQCYALRQLLDARARRGHALVIASPNSHEVWQDYFEDQTAADSIFARIFDKHQRLDLKGRASEFRTGSAARK
jgi:DNA replication protein DnaC